MKVTVLFGTRPEAIKLSPVILELQSRPNFVVRVVHTGQHSEMADHVIDWFGIQVDRRFRLSTNGRTLNSLSSELLMNLGAELQDNRPDVVVVQGDTTTALCGAIASFHEQLPVVHVEAGLRTGDPERPFPEEMNRVLIARLASFHFAPTELCFHNLTSEGVLPQLIRVTGNTVVDALKWSFSRLEVNRVSQTTKSWFGLQNVLITAHRREAWHQGIANIFAAVDVISNEFPEVHFWIPLHLNPVVRASVPESIRSRSNVHIIEPLDYPDMVSLIQSCLFGITDSGGLQEEFVAASKPILVTREETDRPEGVDVGLAFLLGHDVKKIVDKARSLLLSGPGFVTDVSNVYGDGDASHKIVDVIHQQFRAMIKP
jgi:UDP-N-acetylglucosamine 2-epimerase (non-hydrolysing)